MPTSAEVLNKMLGNSCPRATTPEGWNTFEFDLCCATVTIVAKCVSRTVTPQGTDFFYQIREVQYR